MVYTYLLDTGFAAAAMKQKVCSYFKYNLLSKWCEAIVSMNHSALLSLVTSTACVKMQTNIANFLLPMHSL